VEYAAVLHVLLLFSLSLSLSPSPVPASLDSLQFITDNKADTIDIEVFLSL
jgi:hypothetical protein